MSKKIYLDYAAATPVDERVKRAMARAEKIFGNASSLHWARREAKKIIDESRTKVSRVLHCRPKEIVFTGSGTESANLAIFGTALAYRKPGEQKNPDGHIITTKIEHHAVLRACQYLEKFENFAVTYLDVKPSGIIDPEAVRKALRPDTILVSVMYANNEIGTIQPIKAVRKAMGNKQISGKQKTLFHIDASAAAGYLNLNVQELGVDLLTLNGSKIYGPKGVGCLFVRRNVRLLPIIVGGSQEHGRRAGTENPALIAGFAEALALADKNKEKESARLIKLRDYLISEILAKIPNSRLNGDAKLRLPNNINFSFKGIDGEMFMLVLDRAGIAVSTGSACTTTETGPSHVLRAIYSRRSVGIKNPQGWGNTRITLGRQINKTDLEYFLVKLKATISTLRKQTS